MTGSSARPTSGPVENVRTEAPAGAVDYDLHGFVGVRLLGASPADVAAVTRQLGPLSGRLAGEPDIVVRFVERLPLSEPIRHLGLRDAGFADGAFLVLRGPHKSRVRVRIPLERVGDRCEIVCESGLPAVPLLVAVLNMTALAKGVLPVHAAAFDYQGTGILATGWAKGGKTETLLGFMARGARYVGDEWVYVSPDGRRLFGIPEPIKLWDWHLSEVPAFRAAVRRGARGRLLALRAADALAGVGRVPARAAHLVESQRYVHVAPERLFGADRCSLEGPLDVVLLVVSDDGRGVRVDPVDPAEIARRMVFSLEHERLDLREAYLKFRFAFPERSNPLLEESERIQRELLLAALDGKRAYAVYHPYPAPIPQLYEAVAPLL
jgi:hypothetical protein